MTERPRVGEVFTVPIDEDRAGVGQIVAEYGKGAYYFAIFDTLVSRPEDRLEVSRALTGPIRFLALSLDAKLHAGHWSIVDRQPVRNDLPLPAYKEAVTTHDPFDVVDFSGTRRRRASRDEVERLRNRVIVAPARLERALRASVGLEPWLPAFDDFSPRGLTSRELFD